MQVTEIAFSMYPVTDIKRARAFYEGTLGLTPGLVYEGDGIIDGSRAAHNWT